MTISIIAALNKNNVIGVNNQLPWHISEDLKRVKALTLGKPIIMGRNTFESIGKPLPGRHNIVVSRNKDLAIPGCDVTNSLTSALELADYAPETIIFGGAALYQRALSLADRLYLTLVEDDSEGDTYFPEWDMNDWTVLSQSNHQTPDALAYAFLTLERARPNTQRDPLD